MKVRYLLFGEKEMNLNKIILLSFYFLCTVISHQLVAQSFEASPTNIDVSVGESFEVTWTLYDGTLKDFKPPPFKDFNVVGGPNRSTSMQIIGNSMSSSTSMGYVLQATKTGTFYLPKARLVTDKNQTLNSSKIKVNVLKGSGQKNNRKQVNRSMTLRQRQRQNQAQSQAQQKPKEIRIGKDVYLKAILDTNTIYQGEQLTLHFRLYTPVDISDFAILTPPSFTGFWVQDISPPRITPGTEIGADSIIFKTYNLKSYALFPQRSGKLSIDPMDIEIDLRIQSQQRQNSIFSPRYVTQSAKLGSKSEELTVLPPPEEGKPENFSGAVGTYTMDIASSKKNVKVNEALELRVTISGIGNIKLIDPPTIDFGENFEGFDPEVTDDVYEQRREIRGRKKFNYTLIPKKAGKIQLPPVSFSYFDPKTSKYKTLKSSPYNLNVGEGDEIEPTELTDEEALNDVYPIKTNTSLSSGSSYFWASIPFWILLLLPVIGFPAAWWKHRKQAIEDEDVEGKRKRLATQLAHKRLEAAKELMSANEKKGFYSEVVHALWGYLADKVNFKTADLDKENIREVLSEKGASSALIDKLLENISYCEMALFAPVKDADNLQGTYSAAVELISEIEEEIES